MGDADGEISVPIPEIESWMDEALEVVDEGLDHLFLSVINARKQTKKVLAKLRRLECFRNCFIAMNLLIVPVIFSILICYSTRNTIDSTGLEAGFQIAITFLMFLSGSVGLPLYLISLWESYKCARKLKEEGNIREDIDKIDSDLLNGLSMWEDSFLTFMSKEGSSERINEFARIIAERMPDSLRANLERRRNVQVSEVGSSSEEYEDHQIHPTSNFSSDLILEPIATSSNLKIEMKHESKAIEAPVIESVISNDFNELQKRMDASNLNSPMKRFDTILNTNEEEIYAIDSEEIGLQGKEPSESNIILKSERESKLKNVLSPSKADVFAGDEFF